MKFIDIKTYYLKLLFFLVSINICFTSGTDMAITADTNDPGDIRPVFTLSNSINNDAQSSTSVIQATLYDMNDNKIRLDEGNIYINGMQMEPPENYLFGPSRDYYQAHLPVVPGTLYQFQVVFGDNRRYPATVRAPDIEFSALEIADRHPRNKPLELSWTEIHDQYPRTLLLEYWHPEHHFSYMSRIQLTIFSPESGTYSIPPDHIKYTDKDPVKTKELRITLVAQKKGQLDPMFQEGGSIKCTLKIYDETEIIFN